MQGYIYKELNMLLRLILLAGAVLLIFPGLATDLAGIVICIAIVFFQKWEEKAPSAV
jgi:UPF0716 family protein affecting phage T7 exclusion